MTCELLDRAPNRGQRVLDFMRRLDDSSATASSRSARKMQLLEPFGVGDIA